jgi:predicted MFS family arabinose efflux permease
LSSEAATSQFTTDTRVAELSTQYEGWRVVAASSAGVFVSFASVLVYTFGIFLKPLTETFSWSREAVSAAFGIAAMTVAVCSPPLGYLLDRCDPRRIIVPCLVVFGCAFASLGLMTGHLWRLYATFLVLGIVGNGTAQMAYTRAVSSWFTARRGMALAGVMSGGAVGAMVLPPVTSALIERVGWRSTCGALGAMVLLIGVPLIAMFVREKPPEPDRPASRIETRHGASVREAVTARPFWVVVVVLFVSSIAQNGALTHMSALLTDRGVSAGGASAALAVMGGASLVGRFVTGWLLDRFFAPRASLCLLVAAAAGVLLLATAASTGAGVLAALLIGFGMGGEADVTPYLLSRYFGLRAFATLYGLTWTAYAAAGAIGPVLMGRAYDLTGSYEALLTVLGIATLGAALLMLLMPRYISLRLQGVST